MKKAEKVEKVDLSKLPPELADTVLAFRAELIKERSCFGESAEQPLRQRSSFQPNSLEVVGGVLQHRQQRNLD